MELETTLQESYYFNQNEIYIVKCDIVRVSDWTNGLFSQSFTSNL